MRRRRRRRPPSGCLMPSFRRLSAELSPTFCRSFQRVVVWVTSSAQHIGPREELSSPRPDHTPDLQCLYFFNVHFLEGVEKKGGKPYRAPRMSPFPNGNN